MLLSYLLILLPLIVIGDYLPPYGYCGPTAPRDPWNVTSVVMNQQPVANQINTITACGNAQDAMTVGSFFMTISSDNYHYTQNVTLSHRTVYKGYQYCFDYSLEYPNSKQGIFRTTFELMDESDEQVGCFQLNVQVLAKPSSSADKLSLGGFLVLSFLLLYI